MNIIEFLEFSLLGTIAGILGTIVGAGGGFFVVPYLLLLAKLNPQVIIGTSMTMVFFNAISGSIAYIRQKRIDIKTGIKFAIATLPGSILGAYISKLFSSSTYSKAFGLLLLGIGIFILLRPKHDQHLITKIDNVIDIKWPIKKRRIQDSYGNVYQYCFNERLGIIISFLIGLISTSMGIGGGILHVPLMVYVLGFPVHIATATSFFILLISSFFGVIVHYLLQHVDLLIAVYLSVGAIIGAQIGAHLSKNFNSSLIQKILALCLIAVSAKLMML